MPVIIRGQTTSHNSNIYNQNLSYTYPDGLDLRPTSELHQKIVDEVLDRALYAYSKISDRFDSWNEVDKTLTGYKWVDDEEESIQEEDERKPTSIVFPFSYATHETMLTYIYKALTPSPIFRYEGVGPEDTVGAILLEMLIDAHCRRNKVALNLHTMIGDGLRYGLGAVVPQWIVKKGKKRVKQVGEVYGLDGGQTYSTEVVNIEDAVIFEGNGLKNVDPYKLLLDPDCSAVDIQEMSFCGWWDEPSYEKMLGDEVDGKGMFNVKYLKDAQLYIDVLGALSNDARTERTGYSRGDNLYGKVTTVINLFITLIPSEWGLGNGEIPEKWFFRVANGELVIEATRLDFEHGMYPMAVASPDFDGYSVLPVSRLEMMSGMQHVLDWMFNIHVKNVRKAVNDMFVIDPWMLDYDDAANPEPGKLIKLRRPAWGKGVEGSIKQFPVTDVTRGHIADVGLLTNAMNSISGVDDAARGVLRQGGPERLTKAEFQGTRAGGSNRLERVASVIALQALQDIGYMFASHTQQMMDLDVIQRATGDWGAKLEKLLSATNRMQGGAISISPKDLIIAYDVIVKDGTVSGGNFNEGWLEMFKMLMQAPQILTEYDPNKVFEFIAMNMGAKNISDFKRVAGASPQFMPDEQVMQNVEQGNLMPISQGR